MRTRSRSPTSTSTPGESEPMRSVPEQVADVIAENLVSAYGCREKDHRQLVQKLMKTVCQTYDKPAECVSQNMSQWYRRCPYDPVVLEISMPGFETVTKTFRHPVSMETSIKLTALVDRSGPWYGRVVELYVMREHELEHEKIQSTMRITYQGTTWELENFIGINYEYSSNPEFDFSSYGEYTNDLIETGPQIVFDRNSELVKISKNLFQHADDIVGIRLEVPEKEMNFTVLNNTSWVQLLNDLQSGDSDDDGLE